MSRASVANAAARAGAWQTYAQNQLRKLTRLRPFGVPLPAQNRTDTSGNPTSWMQREAHWAVPLTLFFFIALIAAASVRSSLMEEERAVGTATSDIEFLASIIADDLNAHVSNTPAATTNLVRRLIPVGGLVHGQHVIVTDESGTIIAALPPLPKGHTTADQIGATEPLTIFAEKAGVMRLVLPNGHEALATVRSLQTPLGQVIVTQRIDDVLSDWRSTLTHTGLLLAAVASVLAIAVLAYVKQAAKTRDATSSCQLMRDRVDLVLTRGRCGLWDWDLASGHVEWSNSMFEMVGMVPRKGALTFSEVNALIHPSDGGLKALTSQFQTGQAQAIDHIFRMRDASGKWIWLRAKAELIEGNGGSPRMVGIAVDMTETMALEERTAKADIRLRDAIETVSEAFVVWDAENRLVMCNSKFQRFHNLPPDAVEVGTPYIEVMERGTTPLVHSQVTLGDQQPLGARTFEAQLGDGRWLQINERRTKDGGYVSVGTDISTLKRHEEQLIESERRLMNTVIDLKKSRQKLETQAQQLAELADKYLDQKAEAESASRAKSDFLANMGHELRTPLNAILGFSEMMTLEAFGKLGSTHYLEYSQHIHTSGQHLLSVITDVLEMSRLEAGRVRLEKAKFIVGAAIDAAVAPVLANADKNGISIQVEGQRDIDVVADRNAFEKILTIFLNNAVKYTPADGRIVLRSSAVGGSLNLYVEDTGVGMPPSAVEKLGRPFEQLSQPLKNGMRGSGLGLAIARSLVELHDGTMRIVSEEGVGTTVLIQLPNASGSPRLPMTPALPLARSQNYPLRSTLQTGTRSARKLSRTG